MNNKVPGLARAHTMYQVLKIAGIKMLMKVNFVLSLLSNELFMNSYEIITCPIKLLHKNIGSGRKLRVLCKSQKINFSTTKHLQWPCPLRQKSFIPKTLRC